MGQLITNFFKWAWGLIEGIQILFVWLITPLPTISELLGFDVAPIYLVGIGALTIGIIRAIL